MNDACCSPELLFDDPISGDTVCTTCGRVVSRDNALQGADYNTTTVVYENNNNKVAARVVSALELDPEPQWIDWISHRLPTTTTTRRVCAVLLEEKPELYERMRVLGLPVSRTALVSKKMDADFAPWIRRYLGHLMESAKDTRQFDRYCQDVVQHRPALRFVLPHTFVVAAYAHRCGLQKKALAAWVADAGVPLASVQRIIRQMR